MAEQFEFDGVRDVDARILQQRDDVIGGMPQHAILEIDHADLGDAFALGQPDEIGGMIVAQGPGRFGGQILGQHSVAKELTKVAFAPDDSCDAGSRRGAYQSSSSSTSIESASRS